MSNFIADNIDWLVPIGIILVSSLFAKSKKKEAASKSGVNVTKQQAQPQPQPLYPQEFIRQVQRAQAPAPHRTYAPAMPEEGVRAVASEPAAAQPAAIEVHRPAVSRQTLRRAIIWSQILRRPQF